MLLNGGVVGLLQNRLANEDRAGHELGARENPWLHNQIFAVRSPKDCRLDERKIEPQTAVLLHVRDDVLDPFTDAVANDQQQELATLEARRG